MSHMGYTRRWSAGAGRRGAGGKSVISTEFRFSKMKKILEMNGGDGCPTL